MNDIAQRGHCKIFAAQKGGFMDFFSQISIFFVILQHNTPLTKLSDSSIN